MPDTIPGRIYKIPNVVPSRAPAQILLRPEVPTNTLPVKVFVSPRLRSKDVPRPSFCEKTLFYWRGLVNNDRYKAEYLEYVSTLQSFQTHSIAVEGSNYEIQCEKMYSLYGKLESVQRAVFQELPEKIDHKSFRIEFHIPKIRMFVDLQNQIPGEHVHVLEKSIQLTDEEADGWQLAKAKTQVDNQTPSYGYLSSADLAEILSGFNKLDDFIKEHHYLLWICRTPFKSFLENYLKVRDEALSGSQPMSEATSNLAKQIKKLDGLGEYIKSALDLNDQLPFKAFLLLLNTASVVGQYVYSTYLIDG